MTTTELLGPRNELPVLDEVNGFFDDVAQALTDEARLRAIGAVLAVRLGAVDESPGDHGDFGFEPGRHAAAWSPFLALTEAPAANRGDPGRRFGESQEGS